MIAAARREGSLLALDLATRDAALRVAERHGLGAPFSLFLNADPATLDSSSPERASTKLPLLVEVTEQALIARPEAMLRALTHLREAGWGIALDDVGGDLRSLALMPILYPDVIKLDLRLLAERTPEDSPGSSPRSAQRPSGGGRSCLRRGSTPRSSSPSRVRTGRRWVRDSCSGRRMRCRRPCRRRAGRCGFRAAAAIRSGRRRGSV